jgi:hypothetical protein
MFQGEKIKNKNFFLFKLFLEVWQDLRIVIADDSYDAALVGLKCFKEKKNTFVYFFIFFFDKNCFKFGGTHA